jgi:hypothetical protein
MSFFGRMSLALLAVAALAPGVRAEGAKPVQLSLFTPVQIVPPDQSVSGLRLNLIYGKNVDVTGVDWGLVNHDTGNGFAWQGGLVNLVEKDFTGWQDGVANITRGSFTGFQSGTFNQTQSMNGVALGWVNVSKSMRGLQIGLVNVTETLHGLQIGAGNIIQKNKVPFLPIVNWSM